MHSPTPCTRTRSTAAGGQELPTIDAVAIGQELELGPLKLTVGPQEGGDFGAILSGNATRAVPALNYVPSHERQKSPFTARYGAIEFNLDAGWSSAIDALNHTSARLLRRRDYLQVLRRVEG